MRLDKLVLNDFRAFPGDLGDYTFDLAGQNLLIYGENGSGKSSLFRAIEEFFTRQSPGRPFADFKHRFTPTHAGGHITAHFDDGTRHQWSAAGRPVAVQVADTARRKGCLDYRSLLRTNFSHAEHNRVNIFKIVVEELWPELPITLPGLPANSTLGSLWRTAQSHLPVKVVRRWQPNNKLRIGRLGTAANNFNNGLAHRLRELEAEATRLLARFPGCELIPHLSAPGITYDATNRTFTRKEIWLDVDFRGGLYGGHHQELNEARLSAIALALYFAGLRVCYPPGAGYLKLLVLDDVLIGLDLANRFPVLELLRDEFADWQIILLTHDEVWFEMTKEFFEHSGGWREFRLYDAEVSVGRRAPRFENDNTDLAVARKHLAATPPDRKAAAVYARSALEKKLRAVCVKKALKVKFQSNPKRVSADELWQGVVDKDNEQIAAKKPAFIDATLKSRIEAVRSVVLNELSHARATSLTSAELTAAIQAVEDLIKAF